MQIIYPKLDISDPHSIQSLIERIRSKQDGGHGTVDVLINNAGIMSKHSSKYEEAKQVMDVNYWASLRMCQAFVPVMAEGGRIVNLSSIAGLLGRNSKEIQARFRDPEMTLEKLDGLGEWGGRRAEKTSAD